MEAMRYQVKLNLEDTGIVKSSIRVKQGDSAITFVFKVFKNGLDVYSASNIPSVVFKRPDGSSVVGTASVAEGQYTYTLSGNELQYAGSMIADVKFSLDSDRESTCSFAFECVPDTMSPDTNPAGTFVNSLKDIIDAVNEGVEKVEQAAATLDIQEIIDIKNEIQALVDRLPDFTIDSEMSDTSEHALQNKVITNAINRIDEILESVSLTGKASSISITTNNKLAEVNKIGGLSNKVTVDGTTSLESNPIVDVKSEGGKNILKPTTDKGRTPLAISANTTFVVSCIRTNTSSDLYFVFYEPNGTQHQFGINQSLGNNRYYRVITPTYDVAECVYYDNCDMMVELGNSPTSYVPYVSDSYTIPTESRQKLIDMGYGLGISDSLYNSIEFGKTYHNMKSVDLGILNWQYASSNKCFFAEIADSKESNTCILLCKEYANITDWTTFVASDKVSRHDTTGKAIEIRDLSCTTVDQLKAKVSGLIMHYEAASGGQDYKAIVYRRKVGIKVINGTNFEVTGSLSVRTNTVRAVTRNINDKSANSTRICRIISDYNYDIPDAFWNNDVVGVCELYNKTNSGLIVSLPISVGTTLAEMNTWLKSNPITVHYELATEQIYDVTDLLLSDNIVEIEKGGTISFIDSSGVAKAVPYEVTLLGTSDATVRINSILKGNEKEDADNSIVGDAWTSSKTYAVGEYTISGDKLWKCKVQHTNVIPSEGTYWTMVTISSELKALWNAIG